MRLRWTLAVVVGVSVILVASTAAAQVAGVSSPRHFGSDEGLNGDVEAILAPSSGGIVVGTRDGAFRLVGDSFESVRTCTPDRQPDSKVIALFEDAGSGLLWMADRVSVYSKVPSAVCWRSHSFPGGANPTIASVEVVDGAVFVGTEEGAFTYRQDADELVLLDRTPRSVVAAAVGDPVANISAVVSANIGPAAAEDLDAGLVSAIATDLDGNVWVGVIDGVRRYQSALAWNESQRSGVNASAGPGGGVQAYEIVVGEMGVRWAATNRGLKRQPTIDGPWLDAKTPEDNMHLSTVWLEDDGTVWVGTSTQGAIRTDQDGGQHLVEGFLHRVIAGVAISGRTFVADANGVSEIVEVAGELTRSGVAPIAGVNVMVPNRPGADVTALWLGGTGGLYLIDLTATFPPIPYPEVPEAVSGLTMQADGVLRIETASGNFEHVDRGNPPVVERLEMAIDGSPCDDCFANEVLWSGSNATVTVLGTDTADLTGLCADIQVSTAAGGDSVDAVPVDDDCQSAAFSLTAGQSYVIDAVLADRHFNQSEIFRSPTLVVGTQSAGERLGEAGRNPFVWIGAAFLLAGCFGAFHAWRWRGKERIRDASLMLSFVDDRPVSRLKIGRRVVTYEAPTRLHRDDFMLDESELTDEVVSATGHLLLRAIVGDTGQARLTTALRRPFTKRLRLRIEAQSLVSPASKTEPDCGDSGGLDWLPWEAVADDEGPLNGRGLVPVRSVRESKPRVVTETLRVLAARCAPAGLEPLAIEHFHRQVAAIRDAFPDCELSREDNMTFERWDELRNTSSFDVIHFYAHGGTDKRGGFVHMQSEADNGRAVEVYAGDLGLEAMTQPVLLITFAACRTCGSSYEQKGQTLPAGRAQVGLAESVVANGWSDNAVGFSFDVAQGALADFSVGMYSSLGASTQVDVAVAVGRSAMKNPHDKFAVRLYGGSIDGMLFHRR